MGGKGSGRPLSSKWSLELGFSFNKTLGNNLELLRNATLNQDFDAAVIVDGKEGSGKSVLAQQIACFFDVDHRIDLDTQVIFHPDKLKEAILTLKPGKAIVWDEARRGVNRRRSTQDVNIEITDLLAECRQHNLFLVVVMPTFYDMDMNVAVWRTRALIHVWYNWNLEDRGKPLQRGFFRFYNEQGKKALYTNKHFRQAYEYRFIKNACFEATFPHHYVVDEKKYRAKKKSAELAYRNREKTKRACPSCSCTIRYNHTKEEWRCTSCDWRGTKQPGAATHKKVPT